MSLPTVTQAWTISANNRYTWLTASTLVKCMGAFMYSLTQFLVTTCGYTVKGSSNGTTAGMDGTNRITDATKFQARANSGASAISWIVLTDGQGVDWCFSYNSASDDVVRIALSPGGNYVAAGTTTFQPTATIDEVVDVSNPPSFINGTTSLDRVWHMWATSDKKMWRFVTLRSGTAIIMVKGERFTSTVVAPTTHSLANGGGTAAVIRAQYATLGNTSIFTNGYFSSTYGDLCLLHSNGQDYKLGTQVGGESISVSLGASGASNGFGNERPLLQGGVGGLLLPAVMGARDANADGKLGNVIDQWFTFTNSGTLPGLGDTYGNLQLIALGNLVILPWDGVSVPFNY